MTGAGEAISDKAGAGEAGTSRGFMRGFLAAGLVLGGALSALLLLADPYGGLPTRLPIEYAPVMGNQRFSYPALARNGRFEGALFGASVGAMLKPERLNPQLGYEVVNLSLVGGTPWEQAQIFHVFADSRPNSRPDPRLVAFTVAEWCATPHPRQRHSRYQFPHWMYDDFRWSDPLHYFNYSTLEYAFSTVGYWLGMMPARYGADGYNSLNTAGTPYDLKRAIRNIYHADEPIPPAPPLPEPAYSAEELRSMPFPDLDLLESLFAGLPKETVKLGYFPPVHQRYMGAPNSRYHLTIEQCKTRFAERMAALPNAVLLDFWFRNELTLEDSNYWDDLHFREDAANRIEDAIAGYLTQGRIDAPIMSVLADTRAPASSPPSVSLETRAAR